MPHRLAAPITFAVAAPEKRRGENVMTITKDIGPNVEQFSFDALDRPAPRINRGINVFDEKSRRTGFRTGGNARIRRTRAQLSFHEESVASEQVSRSG
jgi:hypothetical protein